MKFILLALSLIAVVTATGAEATKPPHPKNPDGITKPTAADTLKLSIYADNWFVLFVNGKLRVIDPIDFLPHNVVTVDILPEYPMTIAVMAKDNANAQTGLEYGNHMGDGGFILKFSDGTVTNASWKAKCYFKGPLNRDIAHPSVTHSLLPENWYEVDFDDCDWARATEFTVDQINPKESYYQADFKGAKFIWSDDLELDNTVIFRTRIQAPAGYKPRWNTQPELDSSLPFRHGPSGVESR